MKAPLVSELTTYMRSPHSCLTLSDEEFEIQRIQEYDAQGKKRGEEAAVTCNSAKRHRR